MMRFTAASLASLVIVSVASSCATLVPSGDATATERLSAEEVRLTKENHQLSAENARLTAENEQLRLDARARACTLTTPAIPVEEEAGTRPEDQLPACAQAHDVRAMDIPASAIALGDAEDVFRDSRVVPAFRKGVARGLRFISLGPNSPLRTYGFDSGDTWLASNGETLDSPEATMNAFSQLRSGKPTELIVEREGHVVCLRARIVPDAARR